MNRRKFISTCTCCAFASAGAVFLNEKSNLTANSNNFILNRIEVHITEHCNLSCKYCGHFSSIAEKEFYDLDKFKQDMKRMSFILNKQLPCIQLLGGEPLLNPQINEYVNVTKKYFPETTIDILTNAILLDDMDDSFWKTLKTNNLRLVPSIYPIKINWASILDKAKKYDVGIYGNVLTGEMLTVNNIEKFRIKSFFKLVLSLNSGGDINEILKCKPKFSPASMHNGKLYPCYATAYIRHLNKKFNTNFIVSEGDYLDLYKVKDIREVEKFVKKQAFPFCKKYCKQVNGKLKWESSKEHTLSEWT